VAVVVMLVVLVTVWRYSAAATAGALQNGERREDTAPRTSGWKTAVSVEAAGASVTAAMVAVVVVVVMVVVMGLRCGGATVTPLWPQTGSGREPHL
jgi:hypothetical protein